MVDENTSVALLLSIVLTWPKTSLQREQLSELNCKKRKKIEAEDWQIKEKLNIEIRGLPLAFRSKLALDFQQRTSPSYGK